MAGVGHRTSFMCVQYIHVKLYPLAELAEESVGRDMFGDARWARCLYANILYYDRTIRHSSMVQEKMNTATRVLRSVNHIINFVLM